MCGVGVRGQVVLSFFLMNARVRELLELPVKERAQLAKVLIESLDEAEEADADVERAWGAEVTSRIEDMDAGRVQMIPLETLVSDVRDALRRVR